MPDNLLAKLADIAEKQIGDQEDKPHRNTGAALDKYFAADAYRPAGKDEGYPWCASFVSWCVQQFMSTVIGRRWFARLTLPHLARAFDFEPWGKKQGALIFKPGEAVFGSVRWPQRGDIVIYTFSHVGIVAAASQEGARFFTAIEGNSNADGGRDGYAVVRHARTFSKVRCFIRLTPAAEAVAA